MTAFEHPGRHRVAVFVRHGLMPLELALVHQTFGVARSREGEPLYEVVTCALGPGDLRTDADFTIAVRHGPTALAEADTVVVPASHEDDETRSSLDRELRAAFGRIRPGTRVASICTGSFLLAAAGLLDGRPATTHWKSAARFQRMFPAVSVDPDVLYTDDGDVLTSAGEASGIDLCLHMISSDHGSAVANDVARTTVVPAHREGGQAQFIRRPVPAQPAVSTGQARAWALSQLAEPITLGQLAAQAAMSVRTFSRRFTEETGATPMQWLAQQRLDRARELLEESDLPVDRVAEGAGFGTTDSLRHHLRESIGLSPSAYRSTFRGRPVR